MLDNWTTVPDPSLFKHLKMEYVLTFLGTSKAVRSFQEKKVHAPRTL